MMILAVIEVIELANSPQQQHCLDTDDTDEYGHVGSGSSLEGIMILSI